MSRSGEDIVETARSHIGSPFRHHFKPENLCEYGTTTIPSCMERGMDPEGYDCSGLAIASICDVLAIETSDWPMQYRHLEQLKSLEEDKAPLSGDALLFYQQEPMRTHMGIFVTENTIVHASGISGIVEEGSVQGHTVRTGVISAERLLAILRDNTFDI